MAHCTRSCQWSLLLVTHVARKRPMEHAWPHGAQILAVAHIRPIGSGASSVLQLACHHQRREQELGDNSPPSWCIDVRASRQEDRETTRARLSPSAPAQLSAPWRHERAVGAMVAPEARSAADAAGIWAAVQKVREHTGVVRALDPAFAHPRPHGRAIEHEAAPLARVVRVVGASRLGRRRSCGRHGRRCRRRRRRRRRSRHRRGRVCLAHSAGFRAAAHRTGDRLGADWEKVLAAEAP